MSKDFSRNRVLELIGQAWDKCPELRLGQLIVNSAARCTVTPLFYAEDMELAVAVEEFVNWIVKNQQSKEEKP